MPVSVPIKFSLIICVWCLALIERHSVVSPFYVSVDHNKDAAGGANDTILPVQKRFFYSTGYGPGGMNNGDDGDEDDDQNRQHQRSYSDVDDDDDDGRSTPTAAAVEDQDDGNVDDRRSVTAAAFNAGGDRPRDQNLEIFGRRATRKDILEKLDHLRRKMIDYYRNRQQQHQPESPPISSLDSVIIENKMSELYALIRGS